MLPAFEANNEGVSKITSNYFQQLLDENTKDKICQIF
jgi:hypothetical protein